MAGGLPHGGWGKSFERRAFDLECVIKNGTRRGYRLKNKHGVRRVGAEVLGKAAKEETQSAAQWGSPSASVGCSSWVTALPSPPPPLPLQLFGARGPAGWSIQQVFILLYLFIL